MRLLLLFVFSLLTFSVHSQRAAIVLAKNAPAADRRAAEILRGYLTRLTAQPAAITEKAPKSNNPVVFIGAAQPAYGFHAPERLHEDAFFLQGQNNRFFIAGGGDLGAEYGVYSLLELLGCRRFSPRDSLMPDLRNWRLPDYPPTLEQPAFPYRELHYEPAFDETWARWHKLKTQARKKAEWGMFVHTFDQLCPSKTHFSQHPEYYSWNGAQRSPGQLCLSNDTVLQIVIASLKEKTSQKPDALYWSVSQNDNYDYCKCPRCAAADKQYGSPAGTLLAFVNKVAAGFPDKIISTLAYQYTRRAPKGIQPAGNVSICLCSIECNRGLPIAEGCTDFRRDVEEWAALTHNLMIWDYVVQFRSYISPFPNWHTLQPNVQLFQRNGVRMLFEQGSGGSRSEFSDMRAYFLAKLMWNPNVNADSILMDFGKGYYGAAQPFIWNYIHQLTENVAATDHWVGIYGTPQMEMGGFLQPRFLPGYYDSFERGYATLVGDAPARARLERERLPLIFALLEIGKTGRADTTVEKLLLWEKKPGMRGLWHYNRMQQTYLPNDQILAVLRQFTTGCTAAGYQTLHERNYKPEQYLSDYLDFLQHGLTQHHAIGVQPVFDTPPSAGYEKGRPGVLTDGLSGTDDYHFNWLGFEGNSLGATLAFPDTVTVHELAIHFLQDQQSWVFFPVSVQFEVSEDGKNFRSVSEQAFTLQASGQASTRTVSVTLPEALRARAVRVRATNTGTCPAWHTCNGNKCWIFADEIVVK